jgi:hypothetical protein
MPEKYAFIIGIENYQDDKSFHKVDYALADATEIGKVLASHGYKDNVDSLLDSEATKSTIESKFKYITACLDEEDSFILFYAGHGFSSNNHNYLTCWDSQVTDMDNTSIKIQDILERLIQKKCKHVIIFLDSCNSGIEIEQGMRSIVSGISESELESQLRKSEYQLCFASCKADEQSYPSKVHGHGIWTYHLLQSLKGNSNKALKTGNLLTAISLQAYLTEQVTKTIREEYMKRLRQTPCYFGRATGDFVVADLNALIEERNAKKNLPAISIDRISLIGSECGDIKSLQGFKKNYHIIPKEINKTTDGFVQDIGLDELKGKAERIFQAVRKLYQLKREDIIYKVESGTAYINCPDFEIGLSISIHPENPAKYMLTLDVGSFRSLDVIKSATFNELFNGELDSLVFYFTKDVEVPGLIDHLEMKGIKVDYPGNQEYCTINLDELGNSLTVKVESRELTVISNKNIKPMALINHYITISESLVLKHADSLLPMGTKK